MSGEPIWHEGAEQDVLGACLLSPAALEAASSPPYSLSSDDFYRPSHGLIWAALLAIRDSGAVPDCQLVGLELERDGQLLRSGGLPYLQHLISADRLQTTRNVTYHADIVLRDASFRRMVQAGVRITNLAESGAAGADLPEVLEYVRREVEDATAERGMVGTAIPVGESIWPFIDSLDEPIHGVVPTPWPELDDLLNGGLHPGELILLCARTSVGKTIAGLEIAKGAAQAGIPATFVSCEMPRSKVLARLVASTGTVPLSAMVRRQVRPEDMERVKRAADRIAEWPLVIDESPGPSAAQIRASCRSIARKGLGLLVIDQLSFLQLPGGRAPLRQQLGQIGRDLIALAKELQIPVVLIHQLNRGPAQRGDGKPNFDSDIRESDELAHHCDKGLLMWRQEDKPGTVTMIVGKHRDGPIGEVKLGFEGRYARIVSAHSQW